MAKSLRSKWKRKCRAIKRERYEAKELARLKKTLGIDENTQGHVDMVEVSEILLVQYAKVIEKNAKSQSELEDIQLKHMDQDGEGICTKNTLLDQYGNYPVWMSNRKILKYKKGRAKSKKATLKQTRRLTRKQKKNTKGAVRM